MAEVAGRRRNQDRLPRHIQGLTHKGGERIEQLGYRVNGEGIAEELPPRERAVRTGGIEILLNARTSNKSMGGSVGKWWTHRKVRGSFHSPQILSVKARQRSGANEAVNLRQW